MRKTQVMSTLSDLERRIARIEVIESVRYTFNRYFHAIDNNRIDVLINEVFAPNVVVEIANYPPGTGKNLLLDREEQILLLFRHSAAGYVLVRSVSADEVLRAEPFDAVELRMAVVFGIEQDDD